jgi:hypothetical protein
MRVNPMRAGVERGELQIGTWVNMARSPCSMLVASQEQAKQWKDASALLLVYLSDVEMLHTGFSHAMAQIRGG